jgi:hypothetical protein
VSAIWHYSTEIQRLPVDFLPEREDYKRIAGSGVYLKSLAPAPYLYFLFSPFFRSTGYGSSLLYGHFLREAVNFSGFV